MTYRPASYTELVQDATNSILSAIDDGITLMEVEFPAVPANIDGERGTGTGAVMPGTPRGSHPAAFSSCGCVVAVKRLQGA
jgi:hypothetical protein